MGAEKCFRYLNIGVLYNIWIFWKFEYAVSHIQVLLPPVCFQTKKKATLHSKIDKEWQQPSGPTQTNQYNFNLNTVYYSL